MKTIIIDGVEYNLTPKAFFKKGDWITDNNSTFQIVRVENEWYHADDGDKICFDVAHQYYHLWTIQDAKDGDILAVNDTVVIFKDLHNSSTFHSYCHIKDGVFNISKDDMPDWWRCEGFNPANIEQGELLFKTMNEAGYVWDFENKELKQIKQNTVRIRIEF